jgi:hypothetical protein
MEITLYIVLGLSILLNIILIYRGYKLIEELESFQNEYVEFEDTTIEMLERMLDEMKQLDIKGSFESDDEVGVVFKELKDVIEKYRNNF